jgi:hypothetical protein
MTMLHNLTVGHLDPGAIVSKRRVVVLRPLEMDVARRLLGELGRDDEAGVPTLEGGKVDLRDGYLICPWRVGGWQNRTAEEFALRLHHDTGCILADREHSRVIDPDELQGLKAAPATTEGRGGRATGDMRPLP